MENFFTSSFSPFALFCSLLFFATLIIKVCTKLKNLWPHYEILGQRWNIVRKWKIYGASCGKAKRVFRSKIFDKIMSWNGKWEIVKFSTFKNNFNNFISSSLLMHFNSSSVRKQSQLNPSIFSTLQANLTHLPRSEFVPGIGLGVGKCPYDPIDNSTAIYVEKGNPGGFPALVRDENITLFFFLLRFLRSNVYLMCILHAMDMNSIRIFCQYFPIKLWSGNKFRYLSWKSLKVNLKVKRCFQSGHFEANIPSYNESFFPNLFDDSSNFSSSTMSCENAQQWTSLNECIHTTTILPAGKFSGWINTEKLFNK